MDRLANRITASREVTRGLMLGMAIACAAGLAAVASQGQAPESAPAKPAAPAKFSGCVQKAPGSSNTLVISSADRVRDFERLARRRQAGGAPD